MLKVILINLIPFLGTTLGSAMVFLLYKNLNKKIEKLFLGFAGGVMVAASVWSLIIPAIEQSENLNIPKWFPAGLGIILGFLVIYFIDVIVNNLKNKSNKSELNNNQMMIFAVTLHNIPEGLAVGVALASVYYGYTTMTMLSVLMLAIGIAIQNFPEGAIISLPLNAMGKSKNYSFFMGMLSGLVEPISGILAFFITGIVTSILPYVLAFSAGAMLFVVIRELIPQSQEDGFENISTFGFFCGFLLMMILDVALG